MMMDNPDEFSCFYLQSPELEAERYNASDMPVIRQDYARQPESSMPFLERACHEGAVLHARTATCGARVLDQSYPVTTSCRGTSGCYGGCLDNIYTEGKYLFMNGDMRVSHVLRCASNSNNLLMLSDAQAFARDMAGRTRKELCEELLNSGARWLMIEERVPETEISMQGGLRLPKYDISYFGAGWMTAPGGWKACGRGAGDVLKITQKKLPENTQRITYGARDCAFASFNVD